MAEQPARSNRWEIAAEWNVAAIGMDTVSREKRSEMMRAVKGKDTTPERIVRSAAHALGLRFRLHRKELPGRPDLVFAKYRVALFVNGCFWHRHSLCKKATIPSSNRDFWLEKFDQNVRRDEQKQRQLEALGWRVVVLWECQVKTLDGAMRRLKAAFRLARR